MLMTGRGRKKNPVTRFARTRLLPKETRLNRAWMRQTSFGGMSNERWFVLEGGPHDGVSVKKLRRCWAKTHRHRPDADGGTFISRRRYQRA